MERTITSAGCFLNPITTTQQWIEVGNDTKDNYLSLTTETLWIKWTTYKKPLQAEN